MQATNMDIVRANMEVEEAQKILVMQKKKNSKTHKMFESWNNKLPN